MRNIEDPRSPTGMILMPILETERRRNHISLIDPAHPLLVIAERCLIYSQAERPSAQQLCRQLTVLKRLENYTQSKQCPQHDQSDENNSVVKDGLIQDLRQQLQVKDDDIKAKDRELRRMTDDRRRHIQEVRGQLDDVTHLVADRERQLRKLNHQLLDNEQVIANLQQVLARREREIVLKDTKIQELQQRSQQAGENRPESHGAAVKHSINLSWRKAEKAPFKTASLISVVVDCTTAYFIDYEKSKFYQHNFNTKEWTELTYPPVKECSLVMINRLVTVVGGIDSKENNITNKLLSLVGENRDQTWVEKFPAMPTKRYHASVVNTYTGCSVAQDFWSTNVSFCKCQHQWSASSNWWTYKRL